MSGSIWLIMYDIAIRDETEYLDWFHNTHIPEKLARPGYTWAAHYELISTDGERASISGSIASDDRRGFMAFFGGADTRAFLDPSPAQIKPTQPPLTRKMMAMRTGFQSLIAAEEWRIESEHSQQPDYAFLLLTTCDAGDNDEDYGAWCVQSLCPELLASPGFEVAAKLLSATTAAKHITVASFKSLADLQTFSARPSEDDWSARVRNYQVHSDGSPLLGHRIWPQA